MRKIQKTFQVTLVSFFLLLIPNLFFGQAPDLRATGHYALFTAAGAFDNLGTSSVIGGDIGTHVGAVTGFPPGVTSGQIHAGNAFTAQAALDIELAYTDLVTLSCGSVLGTTLGSNQVLTPNVYCLGAASTLSGSLTLDGLGDPNALFIFKVNGTLATATLSTVSLINGAASGNVYWQVNGQFTQGVSSVFQGTLIANGALILMQSSSIIGRGLSRVGAISLSSISANLPSPASASCFPVITASPVNDTVCTGSSVSYAVSASGTGLTYQWRKGTVNLINGGTISGATSATLTISSVNVGDAASTYNVIVTGTCLPNDTSVNASLVVETAPVITTGPAPLVVCEGNAASFSIAATGTSLTYQWRRGTVNLSNTGTVSGVSTAMLSINPVNAADAASNYNVIVSGTCAPAIPSADAALVVNATPAIITGPANQTVCTGSSAGFSVTTSGTSLSYQWRKGTVNLINGGTISGATSASLTLNPASVADAATNYNVLVSGTCAPAAASAHVSLGVITAPVITTGPANQTACAGDAASFSVAASGSGLSYQWLKGTTVLTNGVGIFGANTATITLNPVSAANAATNYHVMVSGACAPDASSANASLIVDAAPVLTAGPVSQSICAGSSVSFSAGATGTGLTWQWRKGTANITNGGTISGATTATLTISPVSVADAATNYNVLVTGICAPAMPSANASLAVETAPVMTTAPASQTVCEGTPASFSVAATGTGLTYQWRKGTTAIVNGGTVSGATSATLTLNPATSADAASTYNVIVSGTCAPDAASAQVALAVSAAPVITASPADQTVCAGGSVSFSASASGTNISYQWRKGTVNITNGGTISGATTSTLNITPVNAADAATNYNVLVTGTCTPPAASGNANLVVHTAPAIAAQPMSQSVCEGDDATISVTATGSSLTYQWRLGNINLGNSGTVSGVTTATLSITGVTTAYAATTYNVVVSGTCAPAETSVNATLAVNTAPVITALSGNQTTCAGGSASFSVTASGTGTFYQWRKGTVNINNGGTIAGATSATLTINPVSAADAASDYNVLVTGTCTPADSSAHISLAVNTAPSIDLTGGPADQSVCEGSSAVFTVSASGTGLSYQWRNGTLNIANSATITGATTAALHISAVTPADAATNYNVVVSGTCAPAAVSDTATLEVSTAPVITGEPTQQTVCPGSDAVFEVTATGTALTYQWRRGSVNLINGGTISGATSVLLIISPVSAADAITPYNVVVSGLCTPEQVSANAMLTIQEPSAIVLQPNNQLGTDGGPVNFTVGATGAELAYQWRKGNVNILNGGHYSGATTATLTINPTSDDDTASTYNVVVSAACSPDRISQNAILWIRITGIDPSGDETPAIALYPNPFTDHLTLFIRENAAIDVAELRIFNLLGMEVLHTAVSQEEVLLNTGLLPAGIYTYLLSHEGLIIQSGKLTSVK